jgi:hypothetical protein
MNYKLFCLASYLVALSSCNSTLPLSSNRLGASEEKVPVAIRAYADDGLPNSTMHEELINVVLNLDFESEDYKFADGSGGMSINLEYKGPKGERGDFLSNNPDGNGDNGAGHPQGQIVAYNLSRILGYSDIYGRAVWYKISGRPARVLGELAAAAKGNKHVMTAKSRLALTVRQPVIEGSISLYGNSRPLNVTGFENGAVGNGVFRASHAIANWIQAKGEQPQDRSTMIGKYRMNEQQAAKDLSTIFLIDALTEQWDRFSGGNIQCIEVGNELHRFVAYDNGGAGVPAYSPAYVGRYHSWVSRFDRQVAAQILALDAFINNGSGQFLSFTNPDDLMKVIGLRNFKGSFKKHLAKTAAHVRATVDRYGEDAFFR